MHILRHLKSKPGQRKRNLLECFANRLRHAIDRRGLNLLAMMPGTGDQPPASIQPQSRSTKLPIMRLADLTSELESIAPTRYAESWDNVGLLLGDPSQIISHVMLAIDYTAEVAAEAEQSGCEAVIAYHPPIFQPLKRIAAGTVIHDAMRRGVAVYSPHTALDVADGGTNDVLAEVLGLAERVPLKLAEIKASQCKLVVFVPEQALANVSAALFAAGAGRIGKYSSCSFRSPGTGTFFGEEGANPAVGSSGQLEPRPKCGWRRWCRLPGSSR